MSADSPQAAQSRARASVLDSGWKVLRIEEIFEEAKEIWYQDNEEGRRFFEQAKVDGEVYVYDQWAKASQESSDVH